VKKSGFYHLRNQYQRLVDRHFMVGLTDSEQKKMDRKGEKLDAYLDPSPAAPHKVEEVADGRDLD
jgi:hypothetical protein